MPRVRFGRPNSTVGGPRKMNHRLAGACRGYGRPAGRGAAFQEAPGTVRACRAAPRGRVQVGPGLYRGVLQLPVKIPQGFLLRARASPATAYRGLPRARTALHQGSARLSPVSCQLRAIIATCVANKVKATTLQI